MGLANPLVNLKQYRDTLAKFINMAGFKDDTQFLMSMLRDEQAQALAQQAAQAPKEEDSNTKAAAILAQVEREKAQLKCTNSYGK
jgi:hypothetical protein